jgi:hypothetical protein
VLLDRYDCDVHLRTVYHSLSYHVVAFVYVAFAALGMVVRRMCVLVGVSPQSASSSVESEPITGTFTYRALPGAPVFSSELQI